MHLLRLQAGTSKENILSATIYLTEISNFPGMNVGRTSWILRHAATI
jgi:enamine deaminase RidA (YjgF/YER057c/UK114 family)